MSGECLKQKSWGSSENIIYKKFICKREGWKGKTGWRVKENVFKKISSDPRSPIFSPMLSSKESSNFTFICHFELIYEQHKVCA